MTDDTDTPASPGKRQVFTRLPADLAAEVEKAAERELLSVSSFCRRAIAAAVRTQRAA